MSYVEGQLGASVDEQRNRLRCDAFVVVTAPASPGGRSYASDLVQCSTVVVGVTSATDARVKARGRGWQTGVRRSGKVVDRCPVHPLPGLVQL